MILATLYTQLAKVERTGQRNMSCHVRLIIWHLVVDGRTHSKSKKVKVYTYIFIH